MAGAMDLSPANPVNSSRFLRLPPEIRSIIYEYVIDTGSRPAGPWEELNVGRWKLQRIRKTLKPYRILYQYPDPSYAGYVGLLVCNRLVSLELRKLVHRKREQLCQ